MPCNKPRVKLSCDEHLTAAARICDSRDRSTKPGGIRWLFLVLSLASLLGTVAMMFNTFWAFGWDQFAMAIIDRVLLVPELIVLGGAAWYATRAARRTSVVTVAILLAVVALVTNLVTVVMTLG